MVTYKLISWSFY